jgi:hypothetical protein
MDDFTSATIFAKYEFFGGVVRIGAKTNSIESTILQKPVEVKIYIYESS